MRGYCPELFGGVPDGRDPAFEWAEINEHADAVAIVTNFLRFSSSTTASVLRPASRKDSSRIEIAIAEFRDRWRRSVTGDATGRLSSTVIHKYGIRSLQENRTHFHDC